MMDKAIPADSGPFAVVAAIAVFVGPLISWSIAKRQVQSSLAVASIAIDLRAQPHFGILMPVGYWF
jgi:hypothetical protein